VDAGARAAWEIGVMGCELVLGGKPTRWIVCAGDGRTAYRPGSIRCEYDATPLSLPGWLVAAREQLAASARESERQSEARPGLRPMRNESQYAFAGFAASESAGGRPSLRLRFRPSDYFTFAACHQSLHTPVMVTGPGRRTSPIDSLAGLGWDQPVPELSHSFGVGLAVITEDGYLAFGRRSQEVYIRPGEIGMAVGEGLSAADHDSTADAPDVFACARRGLREELGVTLAATRVRLLSLGVDAEMNQWAMLGMARVGLPAEALRETWLEHAQDSYEQSLEFAPFTPRHIARFIGEHGPWAPEALACTYHALVHAFGEREVERELPPA
jgi:hypothetical protein